MAITLDSDSHVLVLTGAGVSAESGVPTFRDINGLWEGHDVQDVASPHGFAREPMLVWKFYSDRRAAMIGIVPNAGHRALVELEARLGDRFMLATQNVDGLHLAAGSTRVIEMHGALMRTRCSRCDRAPFADTTAYKPNALPMCGTCKAGGRDALLRPDIVWFGENLPAGVMDRIGAFVTKAGKRLVFIAVGTSGLVYPAAGLVDVTKQVGGTSYLVNLEAPTNVSSFDHVILGPSAVQLPQVFSA
ncbi:MAG: NAD-dependent deacylase [Deltaproteobacteria bacterium]|nr:NAD-dependent deacylase [Deltaproteobacteria bacterium]